MAREFDLVLFGATGFTGHLVADYLAACVDRPTWAIAGRSKEKLEALGFGVPVIVADASDAAAMRALAERTKAVCTTVGPYAKYGSELVAACAAAGTHYCDLAGEIQWTRRMIDAHHETAQKSGARIVCSCGFDSVPSELGTWATQQEFIKAYGLPAKKVTSFFSMSGGPSGGTVASGIETAREGERDRDVRRMLANPYGLDPEPRAARPAAPDEMSIGWNAHLQVFTIPFLMAQINTRVVRRGHALAGLPWGEDFIYREVQSLPGNARGFAMSVGMTGVLAGLAYALKKPALREWIAKKAPQPGEGPSAEARARGHWKVRFVAERDDITLDYMAADDHGDPGYASTAKMLGESALSLALDPLTSEPGLITPSLAMGEHLLRRLRRAGLVFQVRK
ncbi:MAG TPA: saccharopine dehydrogenase NADP-binding domain-containing protein [Kofleriaceae bacterium]|jgi:short subunit dehydrogenase-like uncharacterized protein